MTPDEVAAEQVRYAALDSLWRLEWGRIGAETAAAEREYPEYVLGDFE